jgi:hypothetical protein
MNFGTFRGRMLFRVLAHRPFGGDVLTATDHDVAGAPPRAPAASRIIDW